MIKHYLKVSFRSLLKYRQQTIISIVGLAVGFVCFALSSLWIWYERSFDMFHSGADRIYMIEQAYQSDGNEMLNYNGWTAYPLASHLLEKFPELESSCRVYYINENTIKFGEDKEIALKSFGVDSGFFSVFDVDVLQKGMNSPFERPDNMIITDRGIKQFPNDKEYSVGSIVEENSNGTNSYQIAAIVKAWPAHTNIPFDILWPLFDKYKEDSWKTMWLHTFVKLRKGVDLEEFEKKIQNLRISESPNLRFSILPINEVYYKTYFFNNKNVRYEYIPIFSIAGFLVICSALFNFLALFISRLKMKGKELALCKINGASNGQLLKQILTEMTLVFIFVLLFAFLILEWVYPLFQSVAVIKLPKESVFVNIFLCFIVLILLALTISSIPVRYFKSQTIQASLRNTGSGCSRKYFSKISLCIQCMVGIFFIFCTVVMGWQIHYSKNIDLGFDRENIMSVSTNLWSDVQLKTFLSETKTVPSVQDIAVASKMFLPYSSGIGWSILKDKDGEDVRMETFFVDPKVFNILGFRLENGCFPQDEEVGIWMNEAAFEKLGDNYGIGSTTEYGTVLGTVKNFQYGSPKFKVSPAILVHNSEKQDVDRVYLKYLSGTRAETEKAVISIIKEKLGRDYFFINYLDDEYNEYFKEDSIILGMLFILGLVCIVIALFGIYAMVSLSCEQRRKEIAIRKINGASITLLLSMFVKEYLIVLILSAVLIFPVGYMVMKTWVEQYNNQIQMVPAYLVVVLIIMLLVMLTVAARMWKTLHANPVTELKRE